MVDTAINQERREVATACAAPRADAVACDGGAALRVTKRPFGTAASGQPVECYELRNAGGMRVGVITYGARLQTLETPDANGEIADVTLGFDDIDGYVANRDAYFGAVIGRHANRIANAQFRLNGRVHELPINDPPNSLHGGSDGFDSRVWAACTLSLPGAVGVELTCFSPNGDMGFPGNLAVTLRYTLDDANNLRIHYSAIGDRDTVVNLTSHAYFNLAGAGEGNVLDHVVWLNARTFTPVDAHLIPTGERRAVADTPLDFTTPTPIGARIRDPHDQLRRAEPRQGGYDFNWILDTDGDLDCCAASVIDPASGRTLEMYTTEPGLQFYTGNGFDGRCLGKGGARYPHWGGFALEAQHFPDAPNQPGFASTVLEAGEKYTQTTIYRFGVRPDRRDD